MSDDPVIALVTVANPLITITTVSAEMPQVISLGLTPLVGSTGPPGPPGPPGSGGVSSLAFEYAQLAPLATWTIPVPVGFARRPAVAVYLSSGEHIIADTVASASSVSIAFATPTAGSAVLT